MLLIGPPILRECIPSSSPPIKPQLNSCSLTVPQNPCTQFFFAVNPETVPENLTILLEKSWQYDPLTTLRLIAYLRTLTGGKGFYVSALWLYKTHPLTLSCNLREFASFGSLRVFADILYSIIVNENTIKDDDSEIARRAVAKYVDDSTYRFFHDRVSDLFADLLKSDIQSLNFGNVDLLSYASVDCPSIDSSIDRNTLLCESIAKKVFPKDPSYLDIQDEHYVYRVRNRLKKQVIAPLRTALQDKSPRQLQNDYTLVLMKKAYQKLLKMKMKMDKDNHQKTQLKYYQILLSMILKGNSKVFPATPLSVVSSLKNSEEKELEWKDMVEKLCKQGKLANCVVVCDVSDDMSETAKNLSASMGLMISELSSGPWKESVYGFNESPKPQKIKGDDLGTKLNFIKHLSCTKKVDIEAILNEILEVSIRKPENRVERVFVFSNKEFRKSVNHSWGWNYRRVWEKYEKSGFDRVPEVVFWNIQGMNYSPPAIRTVFHNRLMLINGFSTSLFAFLLNEDALWRSHQIKSVTTAQDVMNITLNGKQYQNLVVLD